MTQDEIIRMAREAGMVLIGKSWFTGNLPSLANEQLERFAVLVAAHEREACAKVAESVVTKQSKHINDGKPFYDHMYWEDIAAAIRARGEK